MVTSINDQRRSELGEKNMKRLILFLFMTIVFLLLTGCANENVYIDSTPAAATRNSLFSQRLTMTASIQQTAVMQGILQATMVAEQVQATRAAQVFEYTLAAQSSMQAATAAYQQTEDALNATRTSQALAEISNQIAYQAQQQQIDIERRRMLNSILGWTVFLVLLAFFGFLGWGFWQFLRASMSPQEPLKPPTLMWDRGGRLVVVNPKVRHTSPQIIEASFSRPRLQVESHPSANIQGLNQANIQQSTEDLLLPEIPAVASWRRMSEEWQGGSLPLGMSIEGMVSVNTNVNPHLLLAGTTASGKTHFGLRPLAVAALADGWQVIIFHRRSSEYLPFGKHPNAFVVPLEDNLAHEAVQLFFKINEEIRRRIKEMTQNKVHYWLDLEEAAAHRTLIIIDDFQDIITALTSVERRSELWQLARSITAEGQRAGIHLVIAVQDPSYIDLDLRIRRYMAPVSFRVDKVLNSRVVLNTDGAESLHPRQFMAILNENLVFGFAFAPDDTDITRFLDDHPHPPLPCPEWLIDPTCRE
jgi:hypothetical protein